MKKHFFSIWMCVSHVSASRPFKRSGPEFVELLGRRIPTDLGEKFGGRAEDPQLHHKGQNQTIVGGPVIRRADAPAPQQAPHKKTQKGPQETRDTETTQTDEFKKRICDC